MLLSVNWIVLLPTYTLKQMPSSHLLPPSLFTAIVTWRYNSMPMDEQKILNRGFVLTFLSQFSLSSVSQGLMTTLPLYLLTLKATEVEIGLLIGSLSVTSLLLRPFVGKLLLRTPEKRFMMGGSFLFAISSAAYLIAPPFWPFLFVRILHGVGTGSFNTASVTFVANNVSESRRGQSFGYFFLSFNLALALSPACGMFVVNRFGFVTLFVICIVLSISSLLIASKLGNTLTAAPEGVPTESDFRVTVRIFPPTFMYFLGHLNWGALTAFFPLYAVSQGVSNPGLFFAAYATVLILGRGLGGRIVDSYSREKVLLPCLASYVVGMTVLAFSKSLPMFIVVAVITGAGHAFLMPSLMSYAVDLAGVSRGPAMGIITAMGDLGIGIGPMLMGIILRFTNFPIMFLSMAMVCLTNFLYFYRLTRRTQGKYEETIQPTPY
jgi:MFS family permease